MTIERVRVGEVLALRRRAVLVQPDKEYEEIGIRSFGRGIFHKAPVSGATLGTKRVFRIDPGDLVISNVFAWEGAIALASEAEAGKIGSHRFMTFVPKDGRLDPSWASWFLRSETGLDLIGQASPGSAGRNRTLAIERFEALDIPLPPIDEQRRVAHDLSRLSDRIDGGAMPLATTSEAVFRGLGESLLTDAVNHLRHGSKEYAPLGGLGRWSSGGTPSATEPAYYDGDTPWAVIGDLNDGVVETTERTITDLGLANSSAKVVPAGTLMVAMYGSIGKLGVAGVDMATNQAIACCEADLKLVDVPYLATFLRCVRGELVQLGQGGAQQNISQGLLKAVLVPVPDGQTQVEFVSEVNRCRAQYEQARALCERQRTRLRALVPSALNEAFAGLR